MRTIRWVTILFGAVAAGFVQIASAEAAIECSVTVDGQNDPAVDVTAVSSAVNAPPVGGDVTVCLAGTFDFGTPALPTFISVAIAPPAFVTSLRIVGLDDAQGRQARIRNGRQALTLVSPSLPRISIENLRFVDAEFTAISILRANESVSISGVHIAGVKSFFFPVFNGRFRSGISISSAAAPIAGEVVISDSVINGGDYSADDETLLLSAGISLSGAAPNAMNQPFTARVRVADNRLVNWSGTGILATGISDATFDRNSVAPGGFANAIPGCTRPNGSGSASGLSLAGVNDSLVRDNIVTLEPALTGTGSPPVCTAGLLVTGVLAGGSHGNVFYRNRVRGSGSYAIILGTPVVGPGMSAELDNLFALNGIGNFVPSAATLFLGAGAAENIFIGDFPTIEDHSSGDNLVLER